MTFVYLNWLNHAMVLSCIFVVILTVLTCARKERLYWSGIILSYMFISLTIYVHHYVPNAKIEMCNARGLIMSYYGCVSTPPTRVYSP